MKPDKIKPLGTSTVRVNQATAREISGYGRRLTAFSGAIHIFCGHRSCFATPKTAIFGPIVVRIDRLT
jgi:hypothetical protein